MTTYRANTSAKTIKAKRTLFITTAKKAGEAAHDFLMEVICHAAPTEAQGNGHGDVRAFNNLLEDVHMSVRTASIKKWVQAYTPIRWDDEGNAHIKDEGMKKPEMWRLKDADENPFFAKPEEVVKPFSARDIAKVLEGDAAKLVEACKAFAAGNVNALPELNSEKKPFKPMQEMIRIATQQKALGFKVTANAADIADYIKPANDAPETEEEPMEEAA